jgi:hypothetical protein
MSKELIKGLRELSDFMEANDLPYWGTLGFYCNAKTPQDFSDMVKKLGSFKKTSDHSYLNAIKEFPGGVKLEVFVEKNLTCKKIVVGKKTVPFRDAQVIPAVPAHEEDIVKWECPESFIDLDKGKVKKEEIKV